MPCLPATMAAAGALLRVRAQSRGPHDVGTGRISRRHTRRRSRTHQTAPGDPHARWHSLRRDRRQGRRVSRVARGAGRSGSEELARGGHLGVRPGVQRRWARALRSLESSEPGRPRGDGLAHHRAESQLESRLHQGRRTGDAAHAPAVERMGPGAVCGPARNGWRRVRARHLVQHCADVRRRSGSRTHDRSVPRRHGPQGRRGGIAAGRFLSLLHSR